MDFGASGIYAPQPTSDPKWATAYLFKLRKYRLTANASHVTLRKQVEN